MAKSKSYKIEVPELDYFSETFNFISNETLKTNLSISFQYIIFLIKVETELQTTGAVEYSIFKNVIQYSASIVEGVMHFGLETAIKNKIVAEKSVMPKSESYGSKKLLHKIDNQTQILGVTRNIKFEKFKKNTQFKTICDAYRKSNLLDVTLIEEVNLLREKRNKIHLAGLKQVENYYTKTDINKAFQIANKIIEAVKEITTNNNA